jgi:hypothetical protein
MSATMVFCSIKFCGLLYTVNIRIVGWLISDKLERLLKEALVAEMRYYLSIYLEGLRKATKHFSQNSWCPGLDLNWTPSEYKSSVTARPICSLLVFVIYLWYTMNYSRQLIVFLPLRCAIKLPSSAWLMISILLLRSWTLRFPGIRQYISCK